MEKHDIGDRIGVVIRGLWRNWAVSVALINLVNVCGLWLPKTWVPVVAFCCSLILYTMIRLNREARSPICDRILYLGMATLFWSGIIMLGINFLVSKGLCEAASTLSPYNADLPYINILVIALVAAVLTGWGLYRGGEQTFCRICRILYGNAPERGLLGNIYKQEGEYTVWMFFVLSLCVAIGEYIYYIFFYINTNINTPDRFFFIYAPLLIFLFSLAVLAVRHVSLWAYYSRAVKGNPLQTDTTIVRYLIVCGDNIFLRFPDKNIENLYLLEQKIDTPVNVTFPHKELINDYEAEITFRNISGFSPDKTRYLYMSEHFNTIRNIFHFACIIDNGDVVTESGCKGNWVSLGMLQRLVADGAVSPMLSSELERVYQMTMAWKSYDRRGYRLYDIKHYKPVFRLRDLASWDVDYNDPNWLFVWNNNEDRAFFRIRRWWRILMNHYVER